MNLRTTSPSTLALPVLSICVHEQALAQKVARTSKTKIVTARMLPMQVLMLFSQGMRCVHRIRLITARNTCTAEVCNNTLYVSHSLLHLHSR